MAAYQKFEKATEDIANGLHNWNVHTLKVALSNTAPNLVTDTVIGDITQISGVGNGYAPVDVVNSVTRSGGVTTIAIPANPEIVASGGDFGPFQYAILYNENFGGLLGMWDDGGPSTVTDGNKFTLQLPSKVFDLT